MTSETAVHFFTSLAVLLAVAKLFGALARRIRQPAVVGEIVAGVACGPLVLPDSVRDKLLPADVLPCSRRSPLRAWPCSCSSSATNSNTPCCAG